MDTEWSKTSTGRESFAATLIASCQEILEQASFVHLNEARLCTLAESLAEERQNQTASAKHWLSAAPAPVIELIQKLTLSETALFITFFHTIGFCYWVEPRWQFVHDGKSFDGSIALALSLCLNARLRNPSLLRVMTFDQFKQELGGTHTLCLLEMRHKFATAVANLLEQPETLTRLLKEESALAKVEFIAKLPGFVDIIEWHGFSFPFYKRAQLLAFDLNYLLALKGERQLRDIASLTAFADYKLPQILQAQGCIKYEPGLSRKIENKCELASGSQEELEIRAATIIAVEKLKGNGSAADIDNQLWLKAQNIETSTLPYHRVLTSFY